jgi:hypothetical protein
MLVAAMLAVPAVGEGITIPIDPRQTFLITDARDTELLPVIVDLSALGLIPGDEILLERLGDYSHGPLFVFPDDAVGLLGVFSSSNTILASSNQFRVPGAIDAGVDFTTGATNFDNLASDIPQDFLITASTLMTIPSGGLFLFASAIDSFYGDNLDPDQDYALRITATAPTVVPEPGSLLLLATGGLAVMRKLRRKPTPS